ncbi:hypothetical protein H6P81_007400 [Aristolochia fimbriata]|uniref:Uncharacterized protein n=1 Tax=Aristolochia fimbriata TaxID=158543 RepID=A0AAV7F2W9_ARIFI|nr:hypothetical protein H6P81_007400 [Aristolochia fimbriata]
MGYRCSNGTSIWRHALDETEKLPYEENTKQEVQERCFRNMHNKKLTWSGVNPRFTWDGHSQAPISPSNMQPLAGAEKTQRRPAKATQQRETVGRNSKCHLEIPTVRGRNTREENQKKRRLIPGTRSGRRETEEEGIAKREERGGRKWSCGTGGSIGGRTRNGLRSFRGAFNEI